MSVDLATRHRRMIAAVALLAASCGAAGMTAGAASPATTEPTGTLRVAPNTNLQTFDPARVQNAQLFYLQPVYDTLLRLDEENTPQPGVAESWEWDGTTATLSLREGPAFADGTAIDAEAVVANIERFATVGGAAFATLSSVEATDDRTVTLTFDGPAPTLLVDLAQAPGMLVNPSSFDGTTFETSPGGTSGPYVLDPSTSAAGDRFVYVPSENYWDASRQTVARLEIVPITDEAARANALQNDEVDVTVLGEAQVDQFISQGFETSSTLGFVWYAVVLDRDGTMLPALADARVRQAMAMAIDREAIAEGVFFGHAEPTTQPYLDGELGHVAALDDALAYDPDAARALLAEAGYADGFELTVPAIPSTQTFAQALANYWSEIGIDTSVELVQAGGMAEQVRSGGYPVFVTPTPIPDPSKWHLWLWTEDAPYNLAWGVVDEELVDMANAAAAPVVADERQAAYDVLFGRVVGDGIIVSVVRGEQIALYADDVSDVVWHTGEFFPDPVGIGVGT